MSLNGTYLGSLSPFFPPFSDPLWRTWEDGTHDYMGTFDVRLPASAALRVGENTFRIENGRFDDDYYFKDVRLEDRYVILGITVGGTVSDGHGHDLEDVRLTLYHDAETTPLATAVTAADGSYQLGVDDLTYGEKYRVTAELESEDHKLVMKEKGTVVSFSRDFTYHTEETEVRLDIDCSRSADLSAASLAKGDVENCASVWHYLQLNRRVAQEIGRDLNATLTVNVLSTEKDDGTVDFYRQAENAIYMGAHTMDDDSHPEGGGAPDDAEPAPWDFRKNRETHEFGHALMSAIMGGAQVARPDIANHAGYANRDTGDSLSEGFAEFWCMVADETAAMSGEPDKYDDWGYLAGANRRMAWAPVIPPRPWRRPATSRTRNSPQPACCAPCRGSSAAARRAFSRSPTTCRRAGTSPTSETLWSRVGSRPTPSTPCSSASVSSPTATATGPTTRASRWAPATARRARCSGATRSAR